MRILQERAREAEEAERRAREDAEMLRRQLDDRGNQGSDDGAADADGEPARPEYKSWKKAAVVAGRRAAALHAPFLEANVLADHQVQGHISELLKEVQRAKEEDEELEDENNPAVYWDTPRFVIPEPVDLVREMIFHLPRSPGKLWLDEWFQDAIKLGIRKQRGDLVHAVAKRPEKIFDIVDPDFEDRNKRPHLDDVIAIMEDFMHIPEENEDDEPDLSEFFRDIYIVRVIRLLLHGPSAILTGRRSSKSRKSHAMMWHVRHVTPSLLALAATVIKFVLSGEPSFEEATPELNYTDWFLARLELLEAVHSRYPEAYRDLMHYYDHQVFPDVYSEDGSGAVGEGAGAQHGRTTGMNEKEKAFLTRTRG